MIPIHSVKELQEVMDFITKFEKFVQHYGNWLQNYPPFGNGDNRGKLNSVAELLVDNLWYLQMIRDHHWHCDSCGKTYKLIDTSKVVLRCKCGGELWLCTHRPPTSRCDTCLTRFKCLTENRWQENVKLLEKVPHLNLTSMDEYQIIEEL